MNKAIFLDREGVINKFFYEVDGNIMSPSKIEQVVVLPKVKEGIKEFKKMGFKTIVVSNQPGVAFGYLTRDNLNKINDLLKRELGINEIYCCTHHPKFNRGCNCRKPKIGLLEKAKEEFNIDIKNSYIVGDNLSDIETGKNANVKKTFLIGTPRIDIKNLMYERNIFPDFILPNLEEVSKKINEIEKSEKLDKLELGSGQRPSEGYIHCDVNNFPHIEHVCNPWEIKIKENSMSEVIALGVIEHLKYEEVNKTLKHIFSILKKEACFLFDVPDMKIWSEYLYNLTHGNSNKNPFPPEHIWATFYGWQRWQGDEHKSGWTKETIKKAVKDAGFSNLEEGVQIYTSKGIKRGIFTRKGDAHIYIKAIK
jgi:D-glycero-D-manno-heptose 1,7-bisphosphate phosphatase